MISFGLEVKENTFSADYILEFNVVHFGHKWIYSNIVRVEFAVYPALIDLITFISTMNDHCQNYMSGEYLVLQIV